MKKAWRLRNVYGYTYVTLFSEDGRILDTYKYHDSMFGRPMPRPFTFSEWNDGLPQMIAIELNERLKSNGEFTEFIETRNDNV